MDTQDLQKIKNRYDIIGNNPGLNTALETAVAVAPTDLTVLITGESGVGKENIPRIIHQMSNRRNGKYFAINCGGIPEGTINSELFGHEKGAYTGATDTRKGYFEEANGGTLFLDEVGELPMSTQVMLLRILQNGEFMKVGSSKVEKTDVRIVAATNVNLLYAVSQGKFREDLYYRLNAIQIRVPALRDRKDDIYLLFRKFTSDFSDKYRVCKIALDHEAISVLKNYRWPGNIRQLKNVTESISALESINISPGAERHEINAATLSKYLPREEENVLPAIAGSGSTMSEDDKKMLVKAILDLKQESDSMKKEIAELKAFIYSGSNSRTMPLPAANSNSLPQKSDSFNEEPETQEAEWQEPTLHDHTDTTPEDGLSLQRVSEDLMRKALEKHGGNRKLAAEELGISERTLYRRLKK